MWILFPGNKEVAGINPIMSAERVALRGQRRQRGIVLDTKIKAVCLAIALTGALHIFLLFACTKKHCNQNQ